MASPKSTIGYTTRTEAVLALRALGHTTRQIADKVGIEPKTVSALEVSALRSVRRKQLPPAEQGRAMLVPLDVLAKMRRQAAKRGMHPNELAARIVEMVVDGGLIDAVLDDDVAD